MSTSVVMPALMTIADAAAYLQVSKQTIYCWIYRKRLPAVKCGIFRRIRADDLKARLEKDNLLDDTNGM